jgi:hypothetical protein
VGHTVEGFDAKILMMMISILTSLLLPSYGACHYRRLRRWWTSPCMSRGTFVHSVPHILRAHSLTMSICLSSGSRLRGQEEPDVVDTAMTLLYLNVSLDIMFCTIATVLF